MRHDKEQLKKSLTVDDIINLLYKLGAEQIDHKEEKGELITNSICHNKSNGQMKLYYYIESQSFHCYTDCSCSFNIYDLVMKVYKTKGTELSFPAAIEWVSINSGKSFSEKRGWGFAVSSDNYDEDWKYLNKLTTRKKKLVIETKKHKEFVLDVFSNYHHPLFLNDNISDAAMNKFEIKYYQKLNRIVIPHRNPRDGSLMGIRGRALNQWEIDDGKKYMPLVVQNEMYNFPSFAQLYGLWQNKETIKRLKKVIIFEGEKSVLQCETYWENNSFAVAVMGKNISQNQIDMLLELGIEEVIIAFDREFTELNTLAEQKNRETVAETARKFSPYVRTYVIWDVCGLLGLKDSPSDKGKNTLLELMSLKQEVYNFEEL